MLKSGGSDYPFELYKKTELDTATPAPYQALMDGLDRRLLGSGQVEARRTAEKTVTRGFLKGL